MAKSDNIAALCDCDESEAAKAALERRGTLKNHPKAVQYKDYRVMLEKQKDIDAVLVATPDHTHAVIAMAAMQLGKHVYVQKPLTRTISEARALTEAARKYKVVTQMGNQGHSEEGLRLMQEWLEGGAIGQVREVHCWTNRPIWPQGMPRPTDEQAVPEGLDWDLWIGPAPMRPFHKTYHPFGWRAWQDFGAGAMGDMACHVMDASFMILKLGAPTSVIASLGYNFLPPAPGQRGFGQRVEYNDSYPPSSTIHLTFPARGNMPPVKLHWYDGGLLPELPDDLEAGRKLPESGTIFVGDKGKMWCETYSESPRLIPESAMQAFQRPPKTLPRVPEGRAGHEKNWLDAIRTKGQAVSNFDYAGPVHRDRPAGQRRDALSRRAAAVGHGGHEGHQHAGRRAVRAAQVPSGLVADYVGTDLFLPPGRAPARRPLLASLPFMRDRAAGRRRRGRDRRPRAICDDVRRFSHEAMATVFEVYAVHPDARYAAQAAQAAFDLADRLESELSRFRSNSDITRVNHLVAGESVRVGAATLECLVIARHLFDLTGGTFDPSIGTGLASLELDADDFQVRSTTGGVQIDLGAIGKGYAVDLMAELLEDWGLQQRARPRRLQLGSRTRAARGPRRLAADPERSRRAVARARPPFGAPDGTRGVRPAKGRPHRGPSHGRTRPRAVAPRGSRSRDLARTPARDREWRQAPSPTP